MGIASLLISCSAFETNTHSESSTTTNNTTIDTIKKKSDLEVYVDAGKEGVTVVKDLIDNKHLKDSIRNTDKDRVWVYQIGSPFSSEELAAKAYNKIKSIPHLYIFRKGRKEYYIVKEDGYPTKEHLQDSLGSVKRQVSAVSSYQVEIKDLSIECSSKKQPTNCAPIKYKVDGNKLEVECKECL
jgi:hypothetical protein